MRTRIITSILALAVLPALAQQGGKKLAVTGARDTNLTKGVDLYRRYCAVCHGIDGKGAGPAAAALKAQPTDLTQLSKTHAGKFPIGSVRQLLGGGSSTPAHGSTEMPMWGPVFRAMHPDESIAKLRADNLLRYLESIQAK
ncbi:MAG TPA: c-type cytochrome [Bryobacteraceae bacterium]|nr:c-type cytochrome [Bryobacteraceae bacterium]